MQNAFCRKWVAVVLKVSGVGVFQKGPRRTAENSEGAGLPSHAPQAHHAREEQADR